jgi:formylglycine-generating enzyme required for sulfatase activity
VQFVSFADTFRFVNWLENGMPSGTQNVSTTENGTYNMALTQPTRQAGSKFWIPNISEWYKAAFYSPTLNGGAGGYYTYPTSSNTLTASAPAGGSNSANVSNVVGTTTNVGSYTTAVTPYGAYDMAGNVAERLDQVSSTSYFHAVGSYAGTVARNSSLSSSAFAGASLNGENATTGFRIAAVPEPSTIALTGTGVVSLLIGWRRKQLKARRQHA